MRLFLTPRCFAPIIHQKNACGSKNNVRRPTQWDHETGGLDVKPYAVRCLRPASSYYSDQTEDPDLWSASRFVEEVEQVRQALDLGPDNLYRNMATETPL